MKKVKISDAEQIVDSIKATSSYINIAQDYFDQTYWNAFALALSRSSRKNEEQSSMHTTCYIWFILYDLVSAVGHKQFTNQKNLSVIIPRVASHYKINSDDLTDIFNHISTNVTPYNIFTNIFYSVDKKAVRVPENSENKDFIDGITYISNRFLEGSLFGELLAPKNSTH